MTWFTRWLRNKKADVVTFMQTACGAINVLKGRLYRDKHISGKCDDKSRRRVWYCQGTDLETPTLEHIAVAANTLIHLPK